MVDSIKITALQDIGANIAYTTLVPVVNMAGTPTSQKSNLQNLGNLILNGAGGSYFPRAAQANIALTVANAAQPNITSVGTLTSLAVTGNINAGNIDGGNIIVANFFYGDGGFLTNVAGGGSNYSNSNVANYLPSYLPSYTGNISANWVIAGHFMGNAHNLSSLPGANVQGFVPNANVSNTALSVAAANVSGLGNIALINLDGNASNVLRGNGTWGADANSSYGNSNVANYLPTYTGNLNPDTVNVAGNLYVSSVVASNANVIIAADSDNINARWTFTQGGALEFPAPPGILWAIEPNIDNEFEFKSTSNIVISTDISNSNSHFTFDSDGIFTAPSNVNLLGSRLNVGPDAISAGNLLNPTLIIAKTGAEYIQAAIINNDGAGSSDWSADGAGGGDAEAWTDMGFAGFSFNDPNYTITEPGDGYLLVQGYANGIGGNMVLATGDLGNSHDIVFATGGFLANNEFARIDHANNMFHLTRIGSGIKFQDGTIQTTAATGGNASLGNLEVTGTTIGIANGASETAIVIGANSSSLTLNTDSGVPVVNLQVQTTDSQFYEESFDYTSGTWVVNGLEGTLTINGYSPAFETFLNNLGQYQSYTITVNGSETTATNGYSYGGGNATFYTLLPPSVDPTTVSTIEFNVVFSNKLLMDPDNGDTGIYVGQFTLDLESQRDVRIRAGDDFSITANDSFQMRANSNFQITTDYNNAQQTWTFHNNGNLELPNGSNVGNIATVNLDGNVSNVLAGDGTWVAVDTPAGANGEVQFNSNGAFSASSQLKFEALGALTNPTLQVQSDNLSYTPTIQTAITAVGNQTGTFAGLTVQNRNNSSSSSTNIYLSADDATEMTNYVAVGINGSTYDAGQLMDSGPYSTYVTSTHGDIIIAPQALRGYGNANSTGGNIHFAYDYLNDDTFVSRGISITNTGALSVNTVATSGSYSFDTGTLGQVLTSSGNAAAPTWTTLGNISSITLDGSSSNVLYGNGVFAAVGGGSYGDSNVVTLLGSFGSNSISTTGNVSANVGLFNDLNLNNAGTNAFLYTDSNRNIYDTQFSYDSANDSMSGGNISLTGNISANNLGNISGVNLDGSSSNVLYGNGVFAQPASIPFVLANANITATINTSYQVLNSVGNANINFTLPDGNGLAAGSFVKINPYDQSLGNFAYFVVTNGANSAGIQGLAAPLSANRPTTIVWGGSFWYYSN